MNFHDKTGGDGHGSVSWAEIEAELRQEFRERAGDMLNEADEILEEVRAGSVSAVEALIQIRQIAHNLKGTGGSVGFPLVTTIAHRLENYAADLEAIDDSRAQDMRVYLDCMGDVINGALGVKEEEFAGIVRDLPAKPSLINPEDGAQGAEIMLVAPSGAATRIITAEIHAIGYRVIAVKSPFEALEQIVQTSPDAVLVSAVMEWLSGVELICALQAMASTKGIPTALLTSFDNADHQLDDLPKSVPVVHKGAAFSSELFAVFASFGMK